MKRAAADIRNLFLRFFEERGHQIVPSSSLIPARDPTLLFANAGMNQFKDVFLQRETRPYARAVSAQKCMRVSGKHNDLEQVGRTPRHHTFFEMLGNFSFGDYFKREAIDFAWELLTSDRHFALPTGTLWATVHHEDDEAFDLWRRSIGLPADRVVKLGDRDNFWSMGDTGPCGPCSEIHVDRGRGDGSCTVTSCGPGCDCGRFVEIWNLVFVEFDRQPDGALQRLQRTGVDTGMGLERIAAVVQGVGSNYDTDLLRPIVEEAGRIAAGRRDAAAGRSGSDEVVALQVIADHVRAMTFLMSDGVVPSNDGRGYVLRRIMRRAIRFGRALGVEQPFLFELSDKVIEVMESVYPELVAHRGLIAESARREEERFAQTLAVGLERVEGLAADLRGRNETIIPGAEAFKLYDTFGLPLDLVRDVAQAWSLQVDEGGFTAAMQQQRDRSRRGIKEGPGPVSGLAGRLPVDRVDFRGYDQTRLEGAKVLAILREEQLVERLGTGQDGQILLDRTPFYAEGGGQVGDTGFLTGPLGVAEVRNTQAPLPHVTLHEVVGREGEIRVGEALLAEVDHARRLAVTRGHDATHLLHAALREVVGTHLKQAGSLVSPDRFRFDFTHFSPLSEAIQHQVEDLVNDVIRQDLPIRARTMPLDEALQGGALAFFGDKYGEQVRVVEIPGFSMELCGGTHSGSTGSIGILKLTHERGIAAGIRRVEALAGEVALRESREDRRAVVALQTALNVERPALGDSLARLLEENRALRREVDTLKVNLAAGAAGMAEDEVHDIGGVKLLVPAVQEELDQSSVRALVDRNRERLRSGVIVQWAVQADRVNVTASVSKDLIPRLHAGTIVKALAPLVEGRGGGRPDMAEAGGRNLKGVDGLRRRTVEIVGEMIGREAR
jgi:alanyl-tRNA synthetase